jgi:adenosyl cobinamide kinase/adenosyl cobinamide phosphate guanylyltransferase
MIFVMGGAYQGKLDYVLNTLVQADTRVFTCDPQTLEIDWSCPVIDKLHLWVWACQQAGLDPQASLRQHLPDLQNSVILCDDLSSGVVPIDPQTRLWRESVGRISVWLAREAVRVVRVFCGLATDLKP